MFSVYPKKKKKKAAYRGTQKKKKKKTVHRSQPPPPRGSLYTHAHTHTMDGCAMAPVRQFAFIHRAATAALPRSGDDIDRVTGNGCARGRSPPTIDRSRPKSPRFPITAAERPRSPDGQKLFTPPLPPVPSRGPSARHSLIDVSFSRLFSRKIVLFIFSPRVIVRGLLLLIYVFFFFFFFFLLLRRRRRSPEPPPALRRTTHSRATGS